MSESGSTRLREHASPPQPAGRRRSSGRGKLRSKQRLLISLALAFFFVTGVGLAIYGYTAGAPDRAETAYQAGMKLMEPGQYQNAIPLFTRAIRIRGTAKAYLERGNAYHFLGQTDQAIADFEKATEFDPSLTRAYSGLGSIYRDRGDRKRALEAFGKAISINPSVDALFERGEMFEAAGEHQKAIDDFTAAIDDLRDAPYIYRARALAKRNLGDNAGYEADRDQARAIERPR
jgi:tetratricopeptide (TPR) repeat protein